MNFQKSNNYNFDKNIFYTEGIYYLIVKIPSSVTSLEYKLLGNFGYQKIGQISNVVINTKKEKCEYIHLTFDIPDIQDLILQISINHSENKFIHLHDFINMSELCKNNLPEKVSIKKNIS